MGKLKSPHTSYSLINELAVFVPLQVMISMAEWIEPRYHSFFSHSLRSNWIRFLPMTQNNVTNAWHTLVRLHTTKLPQIIFITWVGSFIVMCISSSNTTATAPFTHRKKMTSNNEELRGRASINRSIGKSETIVLSTDIPHREMIPAASRYCLPSNSNINRRCTCLALVNPSRPSREGPRILSRLPCMVVKNLSSRFQSTICL